MYFKKQPFPWIWFTNDWHYYGIKNVFKNVFKKILKIKLNLRLVTEKASYNVVL